MTTIPRTTVNKDGSITVDQVTVDPAVANADTTRQQLADSRADLRAIAAAAPVAFTTLAGAQTAMRQMQQSIQAEALAILRLGRVVFGQYDSTD